jgi:hypothetical protein
MDFQWDGKLGSRDIKIVNSCGRVKKIHWLCVGKVVMSIVISKLKCPHGNGEGRRGVMVLVKE